MLDKIAQFFKNLFSGLFGGKKNTTPEKKPTTTTRPTKTNTPKSSSDVSDLPPAEPDFPQDAGEIESDTAATVVVVSENDPVVLLPGDDPATPVAEVDLEVSEEVTIEVPKEVTIDEPETPKHKARYLWCLDNGHGKLTAGKRSPKFADGKQFLEYEFNRDIVKRIITELDKLGVKYFNVVPEVDVDNILKERVARANKKAAALPKIFLSIHANAFGRSGWAAPKGIETWHFHNSRTGQSLARVFQKHLIAKTGFSNRKLKSYPGKKQFYVLRNTNMPAVLTENGFYTNKDEAGALMKSSVRQKIADAHVLAIMEIEKNGI